MAAPENETLEQQIMRLAAEIYERGTDVSPRLVRVEGALVTLRAYLKAIASPDDRLAVWEYLQGDYCKHCGIDDPRCQCWNDE